MGYGSQTHYFGLGLDEVEGRSMGTVIQAVAFVPGTAVAVEVAYAENSGRV